MNPRPPGSTRTYTLCPYETLFRSSGFVRRGHEAPELTPRAGLEPRQIVVLPHVVGFGVAGRLRRRGFDGDRFAGRHRNRGRAGTQAGLLEEIATTRIDLFLFTHGPPSFSRGDRKSTRLNSSH